MSRHELPNRISDDHELVAGFEAEHRTFFGQFYDHRPETVEAGKELLVSGWPGRGGVSGTDPAILADDDAEAALDGLFGWLAPYHDLDAAGLEQLRRMLKREWAKREPRGHERFRWRKFEGHDRV